MGICGKSRQSDCICQRRNYFTDCGNDPKLYRSGGTAEIQVQQLIQFTETRPMHEGSMISPRNVSKWSSDWYSQYPTAAVTNPTGPSSGSFRILRGGGWHVSACYCRSAYRIQVHAYQPVLRPRFRACSLLRSVRVSKAEQAGRRHGGGQGRSRGVSPLRTRYFL